MRRTVASRMRFPELPAAPPVRFKPLAASMLPIDLPSSYTPFPLPTYDEDLAFGPTRLENIPDVEHAAKRMLLERHPSLQQQQQPHKAGFATKVGYTVAVADGAFDTEEVEAAAGAEGAMEEDDARDDARQRAFADAVAAKLHRAQQQQAAVATAQPAASAAAVAVADATAAGSGYVPDTYGAPLIDRLRCVLPLPTLIARLQTRQGDSEFAATLVDMASQVGSYSSAELVDAIAAVHAQFDLAKGMKKFHRQHLRTTMTGHPFDTPNMEMLGAVFEFIGAIEELLCVEKYTSMLIEQPKVIIEMVHFLAAVNIFRPVEWYSSRETGDNRAGDYCFPRNTVGQKTANKVIAWELFDVLCLTVVENRGQFMHNASVEELVELLSGIVAVLSVECVPGDVTSALLSRIVEAVRERDAAAAEATYLTRPDGASTPASWSQAARDALLSRLFFLTRMVYISHVPRDVAALLQTIVQPTAEFFAAYHGAVDATVLARLDAALAAADRRDSASTSSSIVSSSSTPGAVETTSPADDALSSNSSSSSPSDGGGVASRAALLEAGHQLVMRMPDIPAAVAAATHLQLDTALLRMIPIVAPYLGKGGSMPPPVDTATPGQEGTNTPPTGRPWAPKTLLGSVPQLDTMDSVLVFHSSIVQVPRRPASADSAAAATKPAPVCPQLLLALRACRTGSTALVVTSCSLQALHHRSLTTVSLREKQALDNTLLILANEIYHRRVIFVPATEELQLRDAGTFFDEDTLVWSVGVRLAMQLPKPKCRALMDVTSKAALARRYFRKSGVHPGEMDQAGQSIAFYTAGSTRNAWRKQAKMLASASSSSSSTTGHVQLQLNPSKEPVMHSPAALRAFRPIGKQRKPIRDAVFTDHANPKKRLFLYRRDLGIMDSMYRVPHRHLRPGFAGGRAVHDLRGLGVHTPQFPQPAYSK